MMAQDSGASSTQVIKTDNENIQIDRTKSSSVSLEDIISHNKKVQ